MKMMVPARHCAPRPSLMSEFMMDPFDTFFRAPFPSAPHKTAPGLMRTDIKETEDGFEIKIDLPGFKKDDVKAELKDGYLLVEASTQNENEETSDDGHYVRKERFSGSCRRSFYVGEEIAEEDIKALFEDGVLALQIPKKQPEELPEVTHTIAIEG